MPKKIILHLGLGSFHRAHQAVYINELYQLGDEDWGIVAGNIQEDPPVIKALKDSGGKYTLETISPQGEKNYQGIRSLQKIIPYEDSLKEIMRVGADLHTKIISFTVTEAGYYLDLEDNLMVALPDLANDLKVKEGQQKMRTVYGVLYRLLKARKEKIADNGEAQDKAKITLMTCDNLQHNGQRFKRGMKQFICLLGDNEFLNWFENNCSCPQSMVDRITPRPSEEVFERVARATGEKNASAVMGEEFIQWVLEDNFINERPALEKVGVELVGNVEPYENAKIRLLNATHSCIAWAGSLLGYNYIHEGLLQPAIRKMAYDYITNDVIPILLPSPINLENYRDLVLDRFSNAYLKDTNQRVAMDGFSKIPGFIVPTIKTRLKREESIVDVIMLPALFLEFLKMWDVGKISFEYEDQSMDLLVAQAICRSSDSVAAFCANGMLWGDLVDNENVIANMREAMKRIEYFIEQNK